jgi:hypothetical protein
MPVTILCTGEGCPHCRQNRLVLAYIKNLWRALTGRGAAQEQGRTQDESGKE